MRLHPSILVLLSSAMAVSCDRNLLPTEPKEIHQQGLNSHTVSSLVITDLGTFGGGTAASALGINDEIEVVGEAIDADGDAHSFLWTEQHGFVDIGSLASGTSPATVSNQARDINSTSQVTGTSGQEAYIWENDIMTPLGTLGGSRSQAHAINELGHIVGGSQTSTGEVRAFLWSPGLGMENLGTLGTSSQANSLNDFDHVVGGSQVASTEEHAFLWTPTEGMIDLGTLPGGTESQATDINNSDQVVGSGDSSLGQMRAFLWTANAGMQDLGTLGGSSAQAWAINDQGAVVGWSRASTGATHAFLWTLATGMQDLGTLPGGSSSFAYAVNNKGDVAGLSTTSDGELHAVIWSHGEDGERPPPDIVFFNRRPTKGETVRQAYDILGLVSAKRVVNLQSDETDLGEDLSFWQELVRALQEFLILPVTHEIEFSATRPIDFQNVRMFVNDDKGHTFEIPSDLILQSLLGEGRIVFKKYWFDEAVTIRTVVPLQDGSTVETDEWTFNVETAWLFSSLGGAGEAATEEGLKQAAKKLFGTIGAAVVDVLIGLFPPQEAF